MLRRAAKSQLKWCGQATFSPASVRRYGLESVTKKALIRDQAFIDGEWRNSRTAETFAVTDPANTSTLLADVADCNDDDTRDAIAAANRAFEDGPWRTATTKERSDALRKWASLMHENVEDLAKIMTLECGKPLAESRGEVAYAASFFDWFAEQARRDMGTIIPQNAPGRRLLTIRQPVGVAAAITPWNFPAAMITRKVAPALAAGCSIVCKPAHDTPLSALALGVLAEEAGIPKGVFNVVTSSADNSIAVGTELCANPVVRKLSFTGSTAVGKKLYEQCAGTVKRLSLELGGNAPFIVFDDADIPAAVQGAIASKYRNAGQTCVCSNRIVVHENVMDTFASAFAEAVADLNMGHGLDDNVQVGPLINGAAIDKVQRHVDDAVSKGAKLLSGGSKVKGNFFEPTILANATSDMDCVKEETFGPIAPLISFSTEAEAIQIANDTSAGLASYFYTQDLGRAFRVSEALEYGMVAVNEGILSTEVAPFGGIKESGLGREGATIGLDEYVETKYICLGGIGS